MIRNLSLSDAFQVLLLQLEDEGRGAALLGDGVERARDVCLPFLVGDSFPSVYFEFPLRGEPFLDVTLLYGDVPMGARVHSEAAEGTEALFDWYSAAHAEHAEISFGFELDTSKPQLPRAGVHFQPRSHVELVKPFCELIGEPARAKLYLEQAARMPQGWPLSFFGLFRGRPASPLRVCGYLGKSEQGACAADPGHLKAVFDAVGFEAYDAAMLDEVCEVMKEAPRSLDFQFDVFPDGSLGDTFAIDMQFEIEQPAAVCESFERGTGWQAMSVLEQLGAVDERWRLAPGAAFARGLPLASETGESRMCTFTLMPQWAKARWRSGILQPAKLYYLGHFDYL